MPFKYNVQLGKDTSWVTKPKSKSAFKTWKHGRLRILFHGIKINWSKPVQFRQKVSILTEQIKVFSPRVWNYHFSLSFVEQRHFSEYLQQNGSLAPDRSSFIQRNQNDHNICLKLYIYWNKLINQHSVITFKFRPSSAMEIRGILHIGLGYE